MKKALIAASALVGAAGATSFNDAQLADSVDAAPGSCSYPTNCPDKVLPRADKQTWAMNASTIIMP